MSSQLEDLFEVSQQHHLEFCINGAMVEQFATLSGDRSSLHVDPSFGRRSIYRQNVVHGMLAVSHLAVLECFNRDGTEFSVRNLTANFLKPILIDEALLLEASVIEWDSGNVQATIEYVIRRLKTNQAVAKGELVVHAASVHMHDAGQIKKEQVKDVESMIAAPLQEHALEFANIEKGQKENILFKISKQCAWAFNKILVNGKDQKPLRLCSNTNFLTAMLYSTFAGMCLPGRYATILNIESTFAQDLPWDQLCAFAGEVAFKSSLNSILVNVTIQSSGESASPILAQGKLKIQVNSPAAKMPSLNDLRHYITDLPLKNKVVLVTGASRGIGETTVKLFALHGAKVAVNYLRGKDDAHRIAQEINDSGYGEAIAVCADVASRDQVSAMIRKICDQWGTVDVLVNNAVGDAFESDFMDLTWEDVQKDIDIIIRGAFNCCQEVIPHMIRNGQGSIVNVSTVYTDHPPAYQSKYVIAKSGLVGLTRSLAVELASRNIQVNMVVPNIVETDLTAGINKLNIKRLFQNTSMREFVLPADVAGTIIQLASFHDSFVTGREVMVTGESVSRA